MRNRLLWLVTAINVVVAACLTLQSRGLVSPSPSPVQAAVTTGFGKGDSAVLGGLLYNNNDPLTREAPAVLLDLLQVAPGDKVADVGCCTGYHSFALAELVGPRGHVWAVDVDPDSVRFVHERARALCLANLTAQVSRPLDATLPACSMNAILMANVYHCIITDAELGDTAAHQKKLDPLLVSVRRSLAPGGRLLIFDFARCLEPIRRACQRAQLKEVALPSGAAHPSEITLWTAKGEEARRSGTR